MHGDYKDKEYFKKLAAKAGVENIPWVKKAIGSSLLLQNPRVRRQLEKFLAIKIQQNVVEDHPFLPAPPKDEIGQGDYKLCDVITGRGSEYPARIAWKDIPLHGIVTGPTGAGKTTILVELGQQIHRGGLDSQTGERQTATWFFDTEGALSALLASSKSTGCQDILVIHVKSMFKLNRWKAPPGVSQKEHITKLTVQDREIRFMRDFMMYSLRDAAFELINRQGAFNERQLLEHISSKKHKPGTRDHLAQQSLINRMRDTLEYLDSVYDTFRSHNLAALTGKSIVWDMHDLASDHIGLIVGDILLQLEEIMPLYYKPALRVVLMFDEFSHVCNIHRLQRADLKESYMLSSFRVFRKRALAFLIGAQNPFSVPDVVLSNINGFWLTFRPTEGYSADVLSKNLALNREQIEYMMQMPERQVICRTRSYPKAFLGNVGEINLPIATDEEIAKRKQETKQILDSLLEPEPDQSSSFSKKPSFGQLDIAVTSYKLTKRHLDYLELVIKNLFLPVTKLNELSPFSSYKADLLRQQLAEIGPGLLKTHKINTGKKGGPLSVVIPTDAGWKIADRLKIKHPEPLGHGSIKHQFWQHAAYRWAVEKGYSAKIEKWLNGKSVDIGVERDGKKVAMEIALEDREKEISNLIKDLEAGWDRVTFCSLTRKEQNLLRNEIAKRFGSDLLESGKVSFMKLSTFLECKAYKAKAKSKN